MRWFLVTDIYNLPALCLCAQGNAGWIQLRVFRFSTINMPTFAFVAVAKADGAVRWLCAICLQLYALLPRTEARQRQVLRNTR